MAGVIPNVPGTGNNIPISSYTAGISESFPNINRQRIVESSINSKERFDSMPVNVGVNQVLSDRYLEFRINGVVGSFIDLSSLLIELMVKPVTNTYNNLADDVNVAVVNGLANTLFKSVTVFINEKMVESNPIYNYSSYIKQLKSINSNILTTIAKCGSFYDDMNNTGVTKTYNAALFADGETTLEKKRLDSIKRDGIDICFPLLLDIASIDMYLLDGVDIRIRLEMANNNWIIKSDTQHNIHMRVGKAKLWLDRVTPHYNALLALNKGLSIKPMEYIFTKTLHKTYVIGANESSIMIDQPFGTCIPDRLTMLIVDMNGFAGRTNENGLFFEHCDLANTHITINGSTLYNINTEFPHKFAQSYFETQRALGLDKENLITYDSYTKGRSVFCFNFVHEILEGSLPVELSASLRINLKFANNIPSPRVIILLADTTGVLTIDSNRVVTCDVRG